LIRQEIKPEAMRPDFRMVERLHPTAALILFPANQTPRFGEKQLVMNLMRVARTGRMPPGGHKCPSAAVGTHGLRFSITPKRFAPGEPLFTRLSGDLSTHHVGSAFHTGAV
jgi:hypothetical protein